MQTVNGGCIFAQRCWLADVCTATYNKDAKPLCCINETYFKKKESK